MRAWLDRRIGGIRKRDIIQRQLSQRAPNSNAVAESTLRTITGFIAGRESSFRNAARTNRLLQLMALGLRGDYDERAWAAVIDEAALRRNGHTSRPLRTLNDINGQSSLR